MYCMLRILDLEILLGNSISTRTYCTISSCIFCCPLHECADYDELRVLDRIFF